MELDIDRLRKDLMDKYGTAMFSGFPAAVTDLSRIERMSDREILEIALKQGVDLNKYISGIYKSMRKKGNDDQ